MIEIMQFDEDYKDFLNAYSFKDSKETYTNGANLIPTFRAKQGMEHYIDKARTDERKNILGLVNWKTTTNHHRRRVEFSIDFDEMLIPEQVVKIIVEQIKEQKNGRRTKTFGD